MPRNPVAAPRRAIQRALCAAVLVASLPAAQASPALAQKYGCTGCHAAAAKLVGPAFRDVAEKYKGQPDAQTQVVNSIRNGGSGRWGEVPMPPQADVKPADAQKLAAWILHGAK